MFIVLRAAFTLCHLCPLLRACLLYALVLDIITIIVYSDCSICIVFVLRIMVCVIVALVCLLRLMYGECLFCCGRCYCYYLCFV